MVSIPSLSELRTRAEKALGIPLSAPQTKSSEVSPEAHAVFKYKQQVVALAQTMAGADRKPTWTDIMIAGEKIGQQNAEEMANQGIPWSPKIYSDLSSIRDRNGKTIPGYEMRLEGFQINKAHMAPPEEVQLLGVMRASQLAKAENRKPTALDALLEIQKIQQSGEKVANLQTLKEEALMNMYDLDCNHAVAKLFEAVDRQANFKGTVFAKCNFHPADTLMRNGKEEGIEDNGVPWTDGAKFVATTFDGMGAKDTLTLNHGEYHDITLANINRGHVIIDKNTYIEGITIAGLNANFTIGEKSFVKNVNVDKETCLVSLNMAEGATLAHCDLRAATISQASTLTNIEINNVKFGAGNFSNLEVTGSRFNSVIFEGTNLAGTSFEDAFLTNVTFKNADGINFAGATLRDVKIDIKLEKLDALNLAKAESINGLHINGQPVSSLKDLETIKNLAGANVKSFEWKPEMAAQAPAPTQIADIGAVGSIAQVAQDQAATQAQQQQVQAATRLEVADIRTLSDALGGFNAAKDLVAKVQPVESISMSMPGSNQG